APPVGLHGRRGDHHEAPRKRHRRHRARPREDADGDPARDRRRARRASGPPRFFRPRGRADEVAPRDADALARSIHLIRRYELPGWSDERILTEIPYARFVQMLRVIHQERAHDTAWQAYLQRAGTKHEAFADYAPPPGAENRAPPPPPARPHERRAP